MEKKLDNALKILSRIRCLKECALSLKDGKEFPHAMYYTPIETEYRTMSTVHVATYRQPRAEIGNNLIHCTPTHRLHLSGNYEYNSDGLWGKLIKITLNEAVVAKGEGTERWVLLNSFNPKKTPASFLIQVNSESESDDSTFENDWKSFVDYSYLPKGVLSSRKQRFQMTSSDATSLERFHKVLPNWTPGHDEQLVAFMSELEVVRSDRSKTTSRDLVESITTSSSNDDKENILNDDWNKSWMSEDGSEHTIDLCMKRGVIIESMTLKLNREDFPYHPFEIVVSGGEPGHLEKLATSTMNNDFTDSVEILSKQSSYLECIKIVLKTRIAYGIDSVSVRGIQIKAIENLHKAPNFFRTSDLRRYSKLLNFDQEMLYLRSVLLQRLVELFDSVLPYLFPKWDHTSGFTDLIQSLQVILPLSSKRVRLIEHMLEKSKQSFQSVPSLFINRNVQNTLGDTEAKFKSSVFYQIFQELKNSDNDSSPLDYRFIKNQRQWWVCKFIGEGIIDQGGGFRDSLSNISEELCPNSATEQIPVFNLFIPSPNQRNVAVENLQDTYIPNPSCLEFQYYEWVGKLMGGALRTEDHLAFCFPMYFWKMLIGAQVTWADYSSVDEKEVDVINLMENMDEELFESYFVGSRNWTTVLSDGTVTSLKPNGASLAVEYGDRLEYAKLAQAARMEEFRKQVDALRKGLLQVVPEAVLQLLTLKEFEERICGKADIPIEALEKNTTFSGISEDERRRKYLWAALKKFTNEDRSKYLRFITGRRRLPTTVEVHSRMGVDILPSSATCANVLYLPDYSSADEAETKILYAIYNCTTIDTDTGILEG